MNFQIDYNSSALVFNIQTYCIHDGPGIRTTVFLKGCPLHCPWCANPESKNCHSELMFYSARCTGCGRCAEYCPQKGIILKQDENGKLVAVTDRKVCINCGICAKHCRNQAREKIGTEMTVRDVIERVKEDKLFFAGSGGGMTISGGEALMHPHFCENLLAAAHREGIHTAIESSCFASRDVIKRVFAHVDIALLDIKHMDSQIHEALIGVPNEKILDNIRYVHEVMKVPVILRVPVIPGYNNDEKNIHEVARFAVSLGKDISVNLLPYHKLGESKNESLGHEVSLGIVPPDENEMEALKRIIESYGVKTKIGG